MSTVAVEVIYRGIFQRTLARNICRGIVFAARKEGKVGAAFSRYGDSPERNGIPAKQFAVVADTPEELEEDLAKYQPTEVDVTICLDDTLCKGLESWGWNGLVPVNRLLKEDGFLVVVSRQSGDDLLEDIHRKDHGYSLAMLRGDASFSGMWVYRDDHTDARVLGALARVVPELVALPSYEEMMRERWRDEAKAGSARRSSQQVILRRVEPGEGNPEEPFSFELLNWREMEEALVIRGAPAGAGFRGGEGGHQPGRNPQFRKYTTRTMRPVVDFDSCTKCSLCWLQCPDGAFDITPDGVYDPNMEACTGCAVCEAICPVAGCTTMVNEAEFSDNASQYGAWKRDREGYKRWLAALVAKARGQPRSQGFHHLGQYQEETARTQEVS